jgi:hypothetical protein
VTRRWGDAETRGKAVITTLGYYAISESLNADGKFDEESRAFGFVVPYPNISIVIGDDGINDGQP